MTGRQFPQIGIRARRSRCRAAQDDDGRTVARYPTAAKRDGRWDAAYDSPKSSTLPADLQAALDGNARAWAAIDSANRYAILWRVQTAKKAETRARRIAELVAMLGRGELLHPERPRKANAAKASRSC